MKRRDFLAATVAAALALGGGAQAQDAKPFKVGLILPLTGPFSSTGKQMEAGARTFLALNGDTFGGRRIELVVRDDTGTADVTKRIAQELVVRDKVDALAGFGLTPLALAAAPVATQAKVPMVVMSAAASIITEQSPMIVRTSVTAAQATEPLAKWAADNGIKRAMTLVSDYGPGIDVEKAFTATFTAAGGTVENLRAPLANPDFSPFLQRVADTRPDALLVFVPAGVGVQFMKQFVERGLDKSGIKLLAEGSVTDDDILNKIGDPALGTITSHHYSAAHDSAENDAYVAAFEAAYKMRPNFMSVGAYDGIHAIMLGLDKTGGQGGAAMIEAIKGESWLSPRGPVWIDPETRDIVQDIYIREVKRDGDALWNVEFVTVPAVKDPVKAAKGG